MNLIVWDLDDVLNDFTEAWFAAVWQAEHPGARLAFADLRSNPPLQELGMSREDYLDSLDRFRLSPAAQALAPNAAVFDWFTRAGGRFRHAVLTARPWHCVAPAAAWVFTHFGHWVRQFHFVPSPRAGQPLPGCDATKGEALGRFGPVDFFVDDSPANVAAAAALGIRALLFPQPWNQSTLTVAELLGELSPAGESRTTWKSSLPRVETRSPASPLAPA
jgi:hypothetical protein